MGLLPHFVLSVRILDVNTEFVGRSFIQTFKVSYRDISGERHVVWADPNLLADIYFTCQSQSK